MFVAEFFEQAIEVLAPFVNELGLAELSIGGGLGVAYVEGEEAPTHHRVGATSCTRRAPRPASPPVRRRRAGPGDRRRPRRSPLYRVGTIKGLPGIRTYVAVDGGMSDNPRPVLYGSGYETFLPASRHADRPQVVRLVGKHCESGDVLVHDAHVPDDLAVGDVLCHARDRGLRALHGIELQQGPAPRRGVRAVTASPPGRRAARRTTTCCATTPDRLGLVDPAFAVPVTTGSPAWFTVSTVSSATPSFTAVTVAVAVSASPGQTCFTNRTP